MLTLTTDGVSDCCTQSDPTATPTTPTDEMEREDFPLWIVVGSSLGGVALVVVLVAAILLVVCFRKSWVKSGNGQRTENVNGRGYPIIGLSSTAADIDGTDNGTTSLPSVYNAMYDNNIPTTPNVAYYGYSMSTNVAYRTTGDHTMPQHATDDDSSGSGYMVNQLVYNESEESPQDMYDYITLHS